jgi:hypothetical protein
MIPEKFKAWDKIVVTVPIQDQLYREWDSKEVKTIDFMLNMQRGVIICTDAISSGKKHHDLYLAFSFTPESIRLEEVNGTHNKTTAIWEVPYEGSITDGIKAFNLKFDIKYTLQRKRMHLLTSTFFGIVEYLNSNLLDGQSIYVNFEDVKVVKQPKKGTAIVSYVTCDTYVLHKVTSIEGEPVQGQSGNFTWLTPPRKPEVSKPHFNGDTETADLAFKEPLSVH